MRITSWNVNSVRPRLAGLERLVRAVGPDVLCLQETKVRNDAFPVADVEALGFRHHVLHGQAAYHGVAVSRSCHSRMRRRSPGAAGGLPPSARARRYRTAQSLRAGGGRIPDPEINAKFAHKLEFLAALTDWFGTGSLSIRCTAPCSWAI